MKIKKTQEITNFMNRCMDNLYNDELNNYLSVIIKSKQDEEEIKQELKDLGDPEFMCDKKDWPSLYYNIDNYLNTAYHKNIKLDKAFKSSGYKYSYEEIPAHELINLRAIQKDPNRELNDYMILRAFDKPYKTTILSEGKDNWMLDYPGEYETMIEPISKAKGKVCTFGLGIGFYLYNVLIKKEVEEVTVVELSDSVINMFNKCLLPQFPKDKKINIIKGSAFDYFNSDFINQFDYVFVDTWKNQEDGYPMMAKMLEQYNPPLDKVDFWIEDSLTEFLTTSIYLYFESIYNHHKMPNDDKHKYMYKKIQKYFSLIDEIKDVDTLKYYMYDQKVLRDIMATKLK